MSIASDAPAAHTPSVMRSVSLHRKIRVRCVRSSVSSGAGSYGKRRKVSITIRLRRHATSGGGERESRSERSSGGYQETLRVEAAMPRTARSVGVSGMLHRTTVRRADLIEGTVDSLVRNRVMGPDCYRDHFLTTYLSINVWKRGSLRNESQTGSSLRIGTQRPCGTSSK